jgi:excisionase family DNA binding protein
MTAVWETLIEPAHSRLVELGVKPDPSAYVPKVVDPRAIPFAQRLTCTIAEACEVTGLGRTKLYELIGDGLLATTTVGRRRLVLVQSLLSLIEAKQSQACA